MESLPLWLPARAPLPATSVRVCGGHVGSKCIYRVPVSCQSTWDAADSDWPGTGSDLMPLCSVTSQYKWEVTVELHMSVACTLMHTHTHTHRSRGRVTNELWLMSHETNDRNECLYFWMLITECLLTVSCWCVLVKPCVCVRANAPLSACFYDTSVIYNPSGKHTLVLKCIPAGLGSKNVP